MASLKERICQAFCESVEITDFDGGFAISTPYLDESGDRIGMYAVGAKGGVFRIVDNALTIAFIEADGAPLNTDSRKAALSRILTDYGAIYDEELGELAITGVVEASLPRAILDFSALLLRVRDLRMLATERVKSTFEEDVREALRAELEGKARITEDMPVSDALSEITPDMVFYAEGRDPVALFLATSEAKVWQATHLRLIADYEFRTPLSIVAMLDTESALSAKVRAQADNRLDAVPRYRSEPRAAIQRVVTEVLGRQVH